MMQDAKTLEEIVDYLRTVGGDSAHIEVKESVGKLPKSLPETLSSFANGTGGIIILGLSEKEMFAPAKGFNAQKIADALADVCSNKMTPPLRPVIEIVPFEGASVVTAFIDEIPPKDKPCYITQRGLYKGGFIRVADGDRKLSYYEVDSLLEERVQPKYDFEPVPEASLDDLDEDLVRKFLTRQRERHPRIFGKLSDIDALRSLKVIVQNVDGNDNPTLAGLLALGTFPQEFFPRLTIYFTSYMGSDKVTGGEVKYVDALTAAGPVPYILEDALHAIRKNMRAKGVLEGAYRKDILEYPEGALREAICNAIMHRDYSLAARSTQIFIDMYVDRIEFINPGGLYGTVTVDTLDQPGASSSRNQHLARLLEMTPYFDGGSVAENRGTGFHLIQEQLRKAGLPPAEVNDSIVSFQLIFRNEVSLPVVAKESPITISDDLNEMVNLISQRGEVTRLDLENLLGLTRSTTQYRLQRLMSADLIEPTKPKTSKNQSYRLKSI